MGASGAAARWQSRGRALDGQAGERGRAAGRGSGGARPGGKLAGHTLAQSTSRRRRSGCKASEFLRRIDTRRSAKRHS